MTSATVWQSCGPVVPGTQRLQMSPGRNGQRASGRRRTAGGLTVPV